MTRYISKKSSWLRFFSSFLLAAIIALLLCIFLNGPRLGPVYDFLIRLRPAPAVSREILIIDSSITGQMLGDDILEPGAATSLFYTMAELGARSLIIQVPILGLSAGGTVGEEEILHRFDEEFSILSRNIRNLFDAIRIGAVAPRDAARYVGELVELSERGKERLVSALVLRDELGVIKMEEAAAFFGYARRPGDLQVQLIMSGEGGRPGALAVSGEYSRVLPDRDGVLRRAAPIITVPDLSGDEYGQKTLEHIIYGALKTRFVSSEIEGSFGLSLFDLSPGPVLALRGGPGRADMIIPLDSNGAVLFEPPRRRENFRRIGISDFLAYYEADRSLRLLLHEGENLGLFRHIQGEDWPGILFDHALFLRAEPASSFQGGNEERRLLWREARNRYFDSLDDFLYGTAEMHLVMGYELRIADMVWDLSPQARAEIERLTEMRNSVIQSFAALRARHNEVLELRQNLESALAGSFSILGNTRDVEASALLANSILTGRVVRPGRNIFLFLGSLFFALLTCFLIKSRPPASALVTGLVLAFLTGMGFSMVFIFSGPWLNPLVPAAACAAGALFSFAWALLAKFRYGRLFRFAFGSVVSAPCLESVINAGKPLPSQTQTVKAVVVAIKNTAPVGASSDCPAKAVLAFQKKASSLLKNAGGTIIGSEKDLVTACFGSPLEKVFIRAKKKAAPHENNSEANPAPVLRAVDFVSEITGRSDYAFWNFGLDMGNCTFAWTALSGYFALGEAVEKAAIFSRLAARYRSRIVISAAIKEALVPAERPNLTVKKLAVLNAKEGAGGTFYNLSPDNKTR